MPQQLISVLIALLLGLSPTAAPTTDSRPEGQSKTSRKNSAAPVRTPSFPTLARLRVALTTTAEVTKITFSPGVVIADRTLGGNTLVTLNRLPNGWTVRTKQGTSSTVRLLAVLEERTGATDFTISVEKSDGGTSEVIIDNTSDASFRVAQIANTKSTAGAASVAITRQALLGASDPPMPRPDPRRLVLADYYPWYYGKQYQSDRLADRPADPRNTGDAAGVLSMVRQASANGVNGFVVAWNGERQNGRQFGLVLDAERQTNGVATVYIETRRANANMDPARPPEKETVKQWLSEALARSSHPSFLSSDGIPVVFVYRMNLLSPEDWSWIMNGLAAEGRNVRLIGDGSAEKYLGIAWGHHRYIPADDSQAEMRAWNMEKAMDWKLLRGKSNEHLFVATVSPGLDKRKSGAGHVPRGPNGERYTETWEAALDSKADWVLITSWNEWFEGTAIEPGVQSGDIALRQTTTYAPRFASS